MLTFCFLLENVISLLHFQIDEETREPILLLVAAGAGGLSYSPNSINAITPNAVFVNYTLTGLNGVTLADAG